MNSIHNRGSIITFALTQGDGWGCQEVHTNVGVTKRWNAIFPAQMFLYFYENKN